MPARALAWLIVPFLLLAIPLLAQPVVSIGDLRVTEGSNGNMVTASFPLTLSEPAPHSLSFGATITHITTSPDDLYVYPYGSIEEGQTTGQLTFAVFGDTLPEPEETFQVDLHLPAGVTAGDVQAIGTIVDDDGEAGTADIVRSATLLFPWFEVDVSAVSGTTTVISFLNLEAVATLVNVTLWTEYGLPTINFPVYLTGYDQITWSLFDLFVHGQRPMTASDGQDPTDRISRQGPYSQDINYASCMSFLPPPRLSSGQLGDLIAAHTGGPSSYFGGACGSPTRGDSIVRGWITVDTVNQCTTLNPSSPGYFSDVATAQNNLLGDFAIHYWEKSRTVSVPAVHIQARPHDPAVSTPGAATFYGRFTGGTAIDAREPLGNIWATEFLRDRTTLVVWRDRPGAAPVPCGTAPAPMGQNEFVLFDYDRELTRPGGTFFPSALTAAEIGDGGIPFTRKGGWMYLNTNVPSSAEPGQSYVFSIHRIESLEPFTLFGIGIEGVQLGSSVAGDDFVIE